MGIKYEDIKQANDATSQTDIRGKKYTEVSERIKAFRMVFPEGFIIDQMVSNENGVCIFKAEVGFYAEDGERRVLGTGWAYEKETSSFINKTSYIENGDTSAVGRALGMAGFGIDTSIASAEEVQNAIENQKPKERKEQEQKEQKPKATPEQIRIITKAYGDNLGRLLKKYGLKKVEDMPIDTASAEVKKITE